MVVVSRQIKMSAEFLQRTDHLHLENCFNAFNVSLSQQDHITQGHPGQRECLPQLKS